MGVFDRLFNGSKQNTGRTDAQETVKQAGGGKLPEWKNPDREIACRAVRAITDQNLLMQIVREKNYSVEHEAQVRLLEIMSPDTDQQDLFEIADTFGYVPLRVKAAGMLEDPALLEKVANKKYFLGDSINEAARKKLKKLTQADPTANGAVPLEKRADCKVGDELVFGKWDGLALTWKVLAAESGRLLLLCADLLGGRAYHSGKPAAWDGSQLRADLNGSWFYGNPEVFSQQERELIVPVSNDSPGVYYQNQMTWEECYADKGGDVEDHVFLLSCAEAEKYFAGQTVLWQKPVSSDKFRFYSARGLAAPHPWWLRNVTRRNTAAVVVTVDGVVNCEGFSFDSPVPEVRPALWIAK